MSEIKTEIIFDVLSNCRNLTDLTLKRTQFDRPEQFFRDLSTVGNKLTKINLNHNMQLGSVELSDMIEALNKMDDIRIHSLFFDSSGSVTPYHNAPVSVLATKFSTTLRVLKLNTLALTNDVMPYISHCSLLRVLHLYRLINITDESLLLLSRFEHFGQLFHNNLTSIKQRCQTIGR
ncbi:Hypothetical protein NTJ_16339 [Nesidiocoris tenuis]|nr:Hypothetical protein NTJ_16339 [Nesidiocoris tenuis]